MTEAEDLGAAAAASLSSEALVDAAREAQFLNVDRTVSFVCENCRTRIYDEFDEAGSVSCFICNHTVHADTYLGFGGVAAIERGEDWAY